MEAADLENKMYSYDKTSAAEIYARAFRRGSHLSSRLPQPSPELLIKPWVYQLPGMGRRRSTARTWRCDMGIHGTGAKETGAIQSPYERCGGCLSGTLNTGGGGAGRLVFSCDASAPPRQPFRSRC